MTVYALFADALVVLHLLFILFVVAGGLLVLRWRRMIWFHLPAAVWGVIIELTQIGCPLTPLEKWLRRAAGEQGYEGGFIQHYIVPVVYPAGLTREVQFVLAALVVVVNLLVYLAVWRRTMVARDRASSRPGPGPDRLHDDR